jgi:hypothetical protein
MRIILLCVVFTALCACSKEKTNESRIGIDVVTQKTPIAPQPSTLKSTPKDRPAAKPTDVKEWREIQSFTNSLWQISRKNSKAREILDDSIRGDNATLDLPWPQFQIEHAKYKADLEAGYELIQAIRVPDVANDDTKRFMNEAIEALTLANRLELEKTNGILMDLDSMKYVPEEWSNRFDKDVNKNGQRFVSSLDRIFLNYGYSVDDISGATFSIKPNVKPKSTISLNRD